MTDVLTNPNEVAEMVNRGIRPEHGQVSPKLYYDPDVWALEQERIFGSYWVFIGHDSEVPKPGDYIRRRIGDEELVLTRHSDGRVHVVFNRCTHRGNLICQEASGSSRNLKCAYHGWTFGMDGTLRAIPYPRGYGETDAEVDLAKERLGLSKPAQTEVYGGFVFAQLRPNPSAPSFEEFIAPVTGAIDRLLALSPANKILIQSGWINHRYHSNWKMVVESLIDGYHGDFVHRSLLDLGMLGGDTVNKMAIRHFGLGHTEIDLSPGYRAKGEPLLWTGATPEKVPNYIKALVAARGEEKANEALVNGPPHAVIFPNVFIAEMNLMIIQPVGPEETYALTTPILLEGGAELNRRTMLNMAAMGPAGLIIADDGEVQERAQFALHTSAPEWLDVNRGRHHEVDEGLGESSYDVMDETAHRGIWSQYRHLMTAAS